MQQIIILVTNIVCHTKRTLFTGADRHNYIDPDYAYTDEEIMSIEKHKLVYKKYIDDLRFAREEKHRSKYLAFRSLSLFHSISVDLIIIITLNSEYYMFSDATNIGLKPGDGIRPQTLSLDELAQEALRRFKFSVNPDWRLITFGELADKAHTLKSHSQQQLHHGSGSGVSGGSHAQEQEPTQLKAMAKRAAAIAQEHMATQPLTPAQIYKVVVEPSVIDFGEISIKTVGSRELSFFNTLDQPIHVALDVNECAELAQTTRSAQIIPAQTKASFHVKFSSSHVQSFQRSISYRINHSYQHHLIVLAENKLPSLTLTSPHVVLQQLAGVQPDLCYRRNIGLVNKFNTMLQFEWMPIYGEMGTAFSIRPASGQVEPNKELECELVWHGSYLAPLRGTFALHVIGGETSTLTCEAKLGSSQIKFVTRRANIGCIPINMTYVCRVDSNKCWQSN